MFTGKNRGEIESEQVIKKGREAIAALPVVSAVPAVFLILANRQAVQQK